MSTQSDNLEHRRAQLAAYQNPYAFIEFDEDEVGQVPDEPTLEQKRAYFYRLQDPHSYQDVFGESEQEPASPIVGIEKPAEAAVIARPELEKLLDAALGLFKPYVARPDWKRVMDYRPEFLDAASRKPAGAKQVSERLQNLTFSLMPGEKIEYNRAPADRIINELKRLLK